MQQDGLAVHCSLCWTSAHWAKAGETWRANVHGKASWPEASGHDVLLADVRLTWTSGDGYVFEGMAMPPKGIGSKMASKVTLPACRLLHKV